ncbi:MAG: WG repeat-containing protein [Eubacterium sp.]
MKNYRNLIPVLLIALMLFSTYSLFNGINSDKNKYNEYLKEAREYSKKGIVVDAVAAYGNAINIKKSLAVSIEIANMYKDNNMISEEIEWCESIVDNYPEEAQAYEQLLNAYISSEQYDDCYELKESLKKYKVSSKNIDKIYSKIDYLYELGYKGYDEVTIFSHGYCAVMIDGLWGYVDNKGNLVLNNAYLYAGSFCEEKAAIKDKKGNIYYIDAAGNKKGVIPAQINCTYAGIMSGDAIVLADGGKYGYYNSEYKHIFGEYDYASNLNSGVAAVKKNSLWYLIDSKGKQINDIPYQDIIVDEKDIAYRQGRAFVRTDGKYILVDGKGKQVGSESFDDAEVFASDSYAAVKQNGKWGFIDKSGKIVIEPQYEDARSFANGMAAVCKDNRWGYINNKNQVKIECKFDACKDFNEQGCSFVKKEGLWITLKLYSKNY